jgi:hypothetical protein
MEVNLTKEQKEYVDAYNNILNKLSGIQERIDELKVEANEALEELNALRSRERDAFPEQLD